MTSNWTTVAESNFPWEREALAFIRRQFPVHEPYRAWSNFEFIAGDGSINEVDLLVFTPQGFFLIEIKSRPGRLSGDAGTWTWETEGKRYTDENPLLAANRKAKKLKFLLERQKAFQGKGKVPFIEPLVFCSAANLICNLALGARQKICLRDQPQQGDKPARPGIMAAILQRQCEGLQPPRDIYSRAIVRLVSQAMEQAGIRPSQRSRKVSDYLLDKVIEEGPGYQDWSATHAQVEKMKRRIRFYLVRREASTDDRAIIERAALREFQILESLQHPGILRTYNLSEHELGQALLQQGQANHEKQGFAQHPVLLKRCKRNAPPLLFHKATLQSTDASL